MTTTLISNRRWFNRYASIRWLLIIVIILFALSSFSMPDLDLFYLEVVLLPAIIVVLLFDFLQKPSFLEIEDCGDFLELRQYHPDNRLAYWLRESAINRLPIQKGGLNYTLKKGSIHLFNTIEFEATALNGDRLKTNIIHAGWLSAKDLKMLDSI